MRKEAVRTSKQDQQPRKLGWIQIAVRGGIPAMGLVLTISGTTNDARSSEDDCPNQDEIECISGRGATDRDERLRAESQLSEVPSRPAAAGHVDILNVFEDVKVVRIGGLETNCELAHDQLLVNVLENDQPHLFGGCCIEGRAPLQLAGASRRARVSLSASRSEPLVHIKFERTSNVEPELLHSGPVQRGTQRIEAPVVKTLDQLARACVAVLGHGGVHRTVLRVREWQIR